MNEFSLKLNSIDKNELKNFLLSLKKPCFESELLKIAFKNINILELDPLSLYQNHFLLFHLLYKLSDDFYRTNKFLYVHFMRTFLLDYPSEKKCRYYNESPGSFCNSECNNDDNYCDFHIKNIEDKSLDYISEKYFYFDESNYFKMDKNTIETFLNGTWEVLSNYDDYKKSFKILDLPESSSIDTIKKRFKFLAKQFHPDILPSDNTKFTEINNAYQLLIKIIPKTG